MPGVREDCILRSNVGFMALHGGSQDRGTEQIARRAAEQADASYYAIRLRDESCCSGDRCSLSLPVALRGLALCGDLLRFPLRIPS
jgi:hypothetical protein